MSPALSFLSIVFFALYGAFLWWALSLISRKWGPVANSKFWRSLVSRAGIFFGFAIPALGVLLVAAVHYV
jgi:hypothetical protein